MLIEMIAKKSGKGQLINEAKDELETRPVSVEAGHCRRFEIERCKDGRSERAFIWYGGGIMDRRFG